MKQFWKEGLILLAVIVVSAIGVRLLTGRETLAQYEEKKAATSAAAGGRAEQSSEDAKEADSTAAAPTAPASGDDTGSSHTETEGDDAMKEESDSSVISSANSVTTGDSGADDSVGSDGDAVETHPADAPENSTRPDESIVVVADGFSYQPVPDEVFARMQGFSFPSNASDARISRDDLRYVTVQYVDFTGATQQGELVCNKAIAQDLAEIFRDLYAASYPLQSVRLIDDYNADDDLSVAANNTSCFCYRTVAGTSRLSNHALGLAVDINPMYNPYVRFHSDGTPYTALNVCAPYIDRSADFPYKIDENDLCYQLFRQHGFSWGGVWKNSRDYQHFEKVN